VTGDITEQARQLILNVYSRNAQEFEDLRALKFLNNKSTLLKLLPPTEDAFVQHLRRAASATLVDKSANLPKPDLPSFDSYGWKTDGDSVVPVASTEPLWPKDVAEAIPCSCKKGCSHNCSCARRQVPCYIGCKCTGSPGKCR